MARDVTVRPSGTSWGAVLDGWLAAVGVAAILTPVIGLLLTNVYTTHGYASTVPILVAVGISYLVGGYVAGRMAGYRTSWHGMTVAFFGLFVVLALVVVDIALALGLFGATARLIQIMPLVLSAALFETAETFAFGGALSILIAIPPVRSSPARAGATGSCRASAARAASGTTNRRRPSTASPSSRPSESLAILNWAV